MKYRCPFIIGLMIAAIVSISPLFAADDPAARAIMQKVDERDDGDNRTSDLHMILIDKRGQKRVRKISSFTKDKGPDTYRLMFFLHPADVKDTGFLTYDYDDPKHDDDQWLYLPALRKTKRIASSDKSNSFMGSDFNYSDMTSRELEDYDFQFHEKYREQVFNGIKTWGIWAIPRSKKVIKETGYTKSLLFVRQDNDFVIRAIHWVKDGARMKYMDVKKLEVVENIWVATEMHMKTKKGKQTTHKTILTFDRIKFNQELDFNLFTIRRLEKGL